MLAVPTAVGLVESKKWVGSLLVRVNISLEGGAAPKPRLPFCTKLLPTTGLAKLRSEDHTAELQSPDHLACRLLLENEARFKLVVPAVVGLKLSVEVVDAPTPIEAAP